MPTPHPIHTFIRTTPNIFRSHPAAHHMTQEGGLCIWQRSRGWVFQRFNVHSPPLRCMYNAPFVPECQHTLTHKHKHMWLQHKCVHTHTDRAPLYWHSIDREWNQLLLVFLAACCYWDIWESRPWSSDAINWPKKYCSVCSRITPLLIWMLQTMQKFLVRKNRACCKSNPTANHMTYNKWLARGCAY